MVEHIGGVPAHFSVDGAPAWNGVEVQLRYIFGDTKAATVIVIENEVGLCTDDGRTDSNYDIMLMDS